MNSRSDRMTHKGTGFTGHPAIVFWLMNDYGKSNTYMGNIVVLEKWTAQLAAYLCATLDKEVYDRDYVPHLKYISDYLEGTWEVYEPSFEMMDRFNPNELWFMRRLITAYYNLSLVTARSHICDNVEYKHEESAEVE